MPLVGARAKRKSFHRLGLDAPSRLSPYKSALAGHGNAILAIRGMCTSRFFGYLRELIECFGQPPDLHREIAPLPGCDHASSRTHQFQSSRFGEAWAPARPPRS